MKDANRVFANNCRRLREEAGMTQEALGEAAGLSGAYVSEIERGNANPTLLTIQKLAKGLNVPFAVLADFRNPDISEDEIREYLLREIARADNKTIKQWQSFIRKVFP